MIIVKNPIKEWFQYPIYLRNLPVRYLFRLEPDDRYNLNANVSQVYDDILFQDPLHPQLPEYLYYGLPSNPDFLRNPVRDRFWIGQQSLEYLFLNLGEPTKVDFHRQGFVGFGVVREEQPIESIGVIEVYNLDGPLYSIEFVGPILIIIEGLLEILEGRIFRMVSNDEGIE